MKTVSHLTPTQSTSTQDTLVKLNVDIAFTSPHKPIGIGYLLRDFLRTFLATSTNSGYSGDAGSAEALGGVAPLQWAYSLGYSYILLEILKSHS